MFRKISTIFLALVLLLNYTASTNLALEQFSGAFKTFSQESTLAQIKEQILSSNSKDIKTFEIFVNKILDFSDNLSSEQNQHYDIYKNMTNQCQKEIRFREAEIHDAIMALNHSIYTNHSCGLSYDQFAANIKRYGYFISFLNGQVKKWTDLGDDIKSLHTDYNNDLETISSTYQKLLTFIEKDGGASFLQISSEILNQKKEQSFLAISEKLMDGVDDAKNTLNNVNTFTSDIIKFISNFRSNNLKSINDYIEKLNTVKNTYLKNNEDLNNSLEDLRKCIDSEEIIIQKAQSKLSRNTGLKDSASQMCSSFQKEYLDFTKMREDELSMLSDILKILMDKFEKIPQDLLKHLEEIKIEFKKYVNKTEFIPYASPRK